VAELKCSICRKPFESTESTALPFCSDRCRLIDLGRWLGEHYQVTVEREVPEDELESEFQD
jgi:endogenous inhibitor of DNA gyrase (YacG/DUF329 family)